MSINYTSCAKVSDAYNETNDCTVKAVAIACDIPYIKAHAVLKEIGRKPGRGLYAHQYHEAIKKLGYTIKTIQTDAKTISTLPSHLDSSKSYIANVRGHALAVVKGKVEDWSAGRKHRIRNVWEIIPLQSKNAIRKAKRYANA